MNLKPVGIDNLRRTACGREIKVILGFLYEILHVSSFAIEIYHEGWGCRHIRYNERILMNHDTSRFLHFTDYSSGNIPGTGLIQELSINGCVRDRIGLCLLKEFLIQFFSQPFKRCVCFQPDDILNLVFFALFLKLRGGKTAVASDKHV